MGTGGSPEEAAALLDEIEGLLPQATDLISPVRVPAAAALAAASAGDGARAMAFAGQAETLLSTGYSAFVPERRADALIHLVRAWLASGDDEAAASLMGEIETIAAGADSVASRVRLLGDLAAALADAGNPVRAAMVATDADSLARNASGGDAALAAAVDAWIAVGDRGRARELAGMLGEPHLRASALSVVARACAEAGDADALPLALRAEELSRGAAGGSGEAMALAVLARALAATGDRDRVTALAARIDGLVNRVGRSVTRATVLIELLRALAATGDLTRAGAIRDLLAGIPDPDARAALCGDLATALATGGDYKGAERVVEDVPPRVRFPALAATCGVMARRGDHDRAVATAARIGGLFERAEAYGDLLRLAWPDRPGHAAALIGRIEDLAGRGVNPVEREAVTAAVAHALAVKGEHDRACSIADGLTEPWARAGALADVAAAIGARDPARTLQLTGAVEEVIDEVHAPPVLIRVLVTAARAAVALGDGDRALTLVARVADENRSAGLSRIDDPFDPGARRLVDALAELAAAVPAAPAQALIAQAFAIWHWSTPLCGLARVDPVALAALADELPAGP
ncbi:hypothetical protein [Thermocatellispora tengchongensis]